MKMPPKKSASKAKGQQVGDVEPSEQGGWRPSLSGGGDDEDGSQTPPVHGDAIISSPQMESPETRKRKASSIGGNSSTQTEKRGSNSSPPPTASPAPSMQSSPASGADATPQHAEALVEPQAKDSSTSGTVTVLKLLRPKKLPQSSRIWLGRS
ncbi:hypothetical protein PVAP13_1KG139400 [Panicum virgatum]|uniref:Uncharacterized protein n=1 Tax=Panicum virgatum TaxID=38727 RepID=A0A8T0XCS1_PANVG|nr:hypothetical protein PVAP13_1KG139400 [Panicum virgatum]